MVFSKVEIVCNVLVKDFRGRSHRSVIFEESVFFTESDIGRLAADGILGHLQSIPKRDAVGKKVPRFRFGDIPQGVVGGAVVKARIMGDNCLDVIFFADFAEVLARGVD